MAASIHKRQKMTFSSFYTASIPKRRRCSLLQPSHLNDAPLYFTLDLSSELLPDDLVLEILTKLPVISLLRCKSVCKSWNSLISSPNFVKKHLLHSSSDSTLQYHRLLGYNIGFNPYGLQFSHSVVSLIENPLQSPFDSILVAKMVKDIMVVGSCNGLISWVSFNHPRHYVYYLNPFTRLHSKSPRFSYNKFSCYSPGLVLTFGFGYDHVSDSYKTVGIYSDHRVHNIKERTVVKVYTLGDPSNSWRKIPNFPYLPIDWQPYSSGSSGCYGKLVNNTLNWLCVRFGEKEYIVIVSIDLGKETYSEVLLPVVDKYELTVVDKENITGGPMLWVLGGCLCFSFYFDCTNFVLWQMKELGVTESWTILLNISYQEVQFENRFGCFPKPFIMLGTGEVLLQINEDGVFILYNSRLKSFKFLEFKSDNICFDGTLLIESLVSPCLAPC